MLTRSLPKTEQGLVQRFVTTCQCGKYQAAEAIYEGVARFERPLFGLVIHLEQVQMYTMRGDFRAICDAVVEARVAYAACNSNESISNTSPERAALSGIEPLLTIIEAWASIFKDGHLQQALLAAAALKRYMKADAHPKDLTDLQASDEITRSSCQY